MIPALLEPSLPENFCELPVLNKPSQHIPLLNASILLHTHIVLDVREDPEEDIPTLQELLFPNSSTSLS